MTHATAALLADLDTRGLTMPAHQPRPALTMAPRSAFLAHLRAELPTAVLRWASLCMWSEVAVYAVCHLGA